MQKRRPYGDAVVTGYGTIDGRTVFVFSQDFTVFGGSLGEVMAEKMVKVMDLAAKVGAPVIGINDSGGARIQEGVVSLRRLRRRLRPQRPVLRRDPADQPDHGAVRGRRGLLAGHDGLHLHGQGDLPHVHHRARGDQDGHRRGGRVRGARRGDDPQHQVRRRALRRGRRGAVPRGRSLPDELSAAQQPRAAADGSSPTTIPTARTRSSTRSSPTTRRSPTTCATSSRGSSTTASSSRSSEHFAQNIICGFSRLDGHPIGVVGNQPNHLAGVLDINSSEKAARFVRFCDAFNVPLLTFTDVPGFLPGTSQEWGGIIRHGAKLLYAFTEATVPKLTVVTRKAYGGAYDVMNSKHMLADFNFAWPTAEVAVMGPEGAVNIIYRRDLAKSPTPDERRVEADRRLQGPLREPVLGGRARLHRRRDRAAPDPPEADPRAADPADEARRGPEAQARQHPALTWAATASRARRGPRSRSGAVQHLPRRPPRSPRRSSASSGRRPLHRRPLRGAAGWRRRCGRESRSTGSGPAAGARAPGRD